METTKTYINWMGKEIEDLRAMGFNIKVFTPYHWRVDNKIDVFPSKKSYHNIVVGDRGHYEKDLKTFLSRVVFPRKSLDTKADLEKRNREWEEANNPKNEKEPAPWEAFPEKIKALEQTCSVLSKQAEKLNSTIQVLVYNLLLPRIIQIDDKNMPEFGDMLINAWKNRSVYVHKRIGNVVQLGPPHLNIIPVGYQKEISDTSIHGELVIVKIDEATQRGSVWFDGEDFYFLIRRNQFENFGSLL